jgi:tetratricopeptide (TPR) repeat protein
VDLLLAARERGFAAALASGDEEALKREIGEGRPAILLLRLLNVPGSGGDVYHYVVVDGHDPRRDLFRMQFGDGEARWAEIDRIAGAWTGAGRAMLTVRPMASAPTIRAAVELEQAGRLDEAAEQYRRILDERPGSLRAWVNLGNVETRRGKPREAEEAYRRALELSPGDPDASNNLAWLLLEEGARLEEAEALARSALERAGGDRVFVLDTLARIQAARGRCAESEETFEAALGIPGLSPASRAQVEEARRETSRGCCPR